MSQITFDLVFNCTISCNNQSANFEEDAHDIAQKDERKEFIMYDRLSQGEANVRREAADHRERNRQELPSRAAGEQAAKANDEHERLSDAAKRQSDDGESTVRQCETRGTRGRQQQRERWQACRFLSRGSHSRVIRPVRTPS